MSRERRREQGRLTCQTNGKLFRFRSAKMRARSFQTPALPVKPNLLRRVDNVGAIASGRVGDFVRTWYLCCKDSGDKKRSSL